LPFQGGKRGKLVVSINATTALTLFGQSSASTGAGIGAELLTAWAAARAGIAVNAEDIGRDPNAPLAEVWSPGITPSNEALVTRALNEKAFFDTKAQLFTDLGAVGDYRRLFALHTGMSTLNALAGALEDTKLSKLQRAAIEAQFERGVAELGVFFDREKFDAVRLAQEDRVDTSQTSLAIGRSSEDYVTGLIHRGSLAESLSGLDPDARFDIVATSLVGVKTRVAIDLSELGSIPRSLGNVISFVNSELASAGVSTRLEAENITPKSTKIVIGSQVIEQPYVGQRQYALKVDVRGGETVAFEPVGGEPAFYVVGQTGSAGARLVKLADVGGEAGQPIWLERPSATDAPIGAHVSTGYLGAGAPYQAAPAEAIEKTTGTLVSAGANGVEDRLRAAGEAVLKLEFDDGRVLAVTTAWRSDDLEAWRVRAGESEDVGILDDLAERLSQLLHEQGVAAGVDVWTSGTDAGLSLYTNDHVSVSSLTIGGKTVALSDGDDPPSGFVGGLRAGVFARRYEAANVAASSDVFDGEQTFTVSTTRGVQSFTISGDDLSAVTLENQINTQLRALDIRASAAIVDVSGQLTLRFETLHDTTSISAEINGVSHSVGLQSAGSWVTGGLPIASAGEPYGDGVRTYGVTGASPLSTYPSDLAIDIVVDTPAGSKTVSVAISAGERAAYPDSGSTWDSVFQERLQSALNAAGVYVGATSADLSQWAAAEGAGHRIASITINGDALTLSGAAPSLALGGAFSAERSFTSAQGGSATNASIADLVSDPTVAITFDTAWGARTVSASLEPGDARTLEAAALRLNEALAAEGYDLGVVAVDLSGAGSGLRAVTGISHTIRNVSTITLGANALGVSLDPIDAVSSPDDPSGAARLAERAARGASAIESLPSASTYSAPTANASAWFAGRAFDVAVGGGVKVATARAVASGADGSVYVLADLASDSGGVAIKGVRDVALFKYDSAGKLNFTRVLGAAESASGYALAVSADGNVAIGGAVTGGLANAGAVGGAEDSFVSLFDAAGKELWTKRRGASANDQVNAIAFAPDGSVIVAGRTDSALGAAAALGGSDGYVRGYSETGLELFTRQFGGAFADTASALLVRDDGAGGAEIYTGGVENNRGVVRRFTYSSSAGFADGVSRDIGYFFGGAVNALAADGASLYVGGQAGVDRVTVGASARGAVAGNDGFVARLDADLVSANLDRTTYLGSAQSDAVTDLAIVNGLVYASGAAGGAIAGQGSAGAKSAFVARLEADGEVGWLRSFQSAAGALDAPRIGVDADGVSALDALGLPSGIVGATDSTAVVARSALRVGDEFQIGREGSLLTTIAVTAADTMSSLLARINRAIGGAGFAELVREDGADRIRIHAARGEAVRVAPGASGRDALAGLGFVNGVIAESNQGRGEKRVFGLGVIGGDLKLDTPAAIAQTKAELSAALSIVRRAYDAVINPNSKPLTPEEEALEARRNAGGAPAYLQAQLANYTAALVRLGGTV